MGDCAWNKKAADVELTPAAVDAWTIYCRAQTQWNVGMSGATGLRYEGLEAGARMSGVEVTPRVFYLVQLLEGKRLSIWHEERVAAEEAAKRKSK
jgi:Phage related hypothetical protein (DUF1799)